MKITIAKLLTLPVGGYVTANTVDNTSHNIRVLLLQNKQAIRFWWSIRHADNNKLLVVTKLGKRNIGEKRCTSAFGAESLSKNS